ncbi:unnamed protein product [Pleuronectes platessa]|uniref:Uncharacterized protein n=1 Tax=Pleuronectes platessa TaxID=8262 RepID=A0A9N7UJZ5_PLEPL|nr:unnamed protein product [Pleuronectes platessa]
MLFSAVAVKKARAVISAQNTFNLHGRFPQTENATSDVMASGSVRTRTSVAPSTANLPGRNTRRQAGSVLTSQRNTLVSRGPRLPQVKRRFPPPGVRNFK